MARTLFARFLADRRATTIVEYGLIIAVMSLAIIGAAAGGFLSIEDKFTFLGDTIKNG